MKKLNFNLSMWVFLLVMLGNLIVNTPANAEDQVSTDTTTTTTPETAVTTETATTTDSNVDSATVPDTVATTTSEVLEIPTASPTVTTTLDQPATSTLDTATTTTDTATTTLDVATTTSTINSTDANSNNSGTNQSVTSASGNSIPPPLIDPAALRSAAGKIINFLKSQIDSSGKIIDGGTTDWSVMSFAADGQYAGQIDPNLLAQIKQYNFSDPSDLNVCAGYPRHLLALLAAGISANDDSITGLVNQIKNTCWQTGGIYGQAGINDDVFGLFALLAAGSTTDEPIITTIISTLQADQTVDGSFTWNGWPSPDITGASINALKYAQTRGANIDSAIFSRAKSYLKSNQLSDGGWGFGASDPLTTGWALMGINALGESQSDWQNSQGNNPWGALVSTLKDGGYYESAWAPGTIDWFGTKHAVPALMNKSWPIILTPTATAPASQTTTASATTNNYGGTSTSVSTNTPETSTTTTTSTTSSTTSTIVDTALDSTTPTTSSTTSTAEIQSNTTTVDVITTKATPTPTATSIATNNAPKPTRRINMVTTPPAQDTAEQPLQLTAVPVEPTLSAGPVETKSADGLIDQLPLDSPSKKTAKKILVLSGGSTVALGAYLGLRLLRGVL